MPEALHYSINKFFILAIYSIKDLEKLCGIKAHTIRIWEQRYGLVVPKRTKTNIRYYQDEDLKHLLNVVFLNKNGTKISMIAKMSRQEITNEVSNNVAIGAENNAQLNALTISMIEMDELKFHHVMCKNVKEVGFEKTMLEVIYPFLEKLGVLWLTGTVTPAQENFMSCLIRQKILMAIDSLPISSGRGVRKFMIFLPEGENQELSLMFMHYLLKSRGHQVIYMGLNNSVYDLQDAYNIRRPSYIFTMISETFTKQPVQKYVDQLAKTFSDSQILLSGYQVISQSIERPDNVRLLRSLRETITFLDELKTI